jgi:cobalt/nickel transport system permease protein
MHHRYIDRFAHGDSPVHRLDALAKLIAVVAYSAVLISFHRYAVAELVPLAVMPMAMLWFGGVPAWFALRRVLLLSPFILFVCVASPWYDRAPQMANFGPWRFEIAGGWLTSADIAVKFTLGVLALTALTSTTRFAWMLEGMRRLGAPTMLLVQLGFLYRYLFVLIDEAMRVRRSRDFRGAALAPVGRRLSAAGSIIANLFVRTLERSEHISMAMAARGYAGEWHGLNVLRFRAWDGAFLAGVALYLAACRCPWLMGR